MSGGYCVLNEIHSMILDRLSRRPPESYSWQAASKGAPFIARKVGEEAVEVLVEALRGDREGLIREASDLLYHLLLLLTFYQIEPRDVEGELRRRMKR